MNAFPNAQPESSWHERLTVVAIVVLIHLVLYAFWLTRPEPPRVAVNELSLSFAQPSRQQADVAPQPVTEHRHAPRPEPRAFEPEAPQSSAEQREEQPALTTETPPPTVQLDTDPDYRADYLNNPRPSYPLAARRMGYQGKVILNVEVLADGRAGEVKLHTSSGYEILDESALRTVRTWSFSPARRFGQPVAQWFLVPIKFSLKE